MHTSVTRKSRKHNICCKFYDFDEKTKYYIVIRKKNINISKLYLYLI